MNKFFLLILTFMVTGAWATEPVKWIRANAISPDGKTIAFTYKGDLFTVPAEGGPASRLTSNAAYDGWPCWSPNGEQIAFASDRMGSMDVYLISRNGGTPQRLTTNSAHEYPQTFIDNEHILFTAYYMPTAQDIFFPGSLSQVYSVDVKGHRPELFSAITMENISINANGSLLYHNYKGYEDPWRKRHHSPITRDIYLTQADAKQRTYQQLSTDNAENRNPVWANDNQHYYFLSERNGSMNVFKGDVNSQNVKQITHFKEHPVRYLSISRGGTLCFSHDGTLYTLANEGNPKKVEIEITIDDNEAYRQPQVVSSGATSFDISKDEKEIAFTLNGDLYTTVTDYATSKRLTFTPEEERHPSISPDGRTIVYASERGNNWNIYAIRIQNKEDKNFTYATDVKEEALITGKEPYFLPKFSPDGKKIAFLANRTELRIYDVKTKNINVALPAQFNFSYSDGDMNFQWSPDSRWLLTSYMGINGWNNMDVAIVSADGKQVIDLTNSGYSDGAPQWALGGKAIVWSSDRAGYRSHGSWGAEHDAYLMFLDRKAYELAQLNKEDRALYEEREKLHADSTAPKPKKEQKKGKASADTTKAKADSTVKPLKLDFEGREDRIMRLTIHSSHLGLMFLSPDGKKFYYTARFEGGQDLWVHNLEENSTKILCKGLGSGQMIPDKKGESLYMCNGTFRKITLADGKIKDLPFRAEQEAQSPAQRAYIYDHSVNQILARFCDVNYHGVDFKSLAAHYREFLPSIGNHRDLSEMVSELLGELNCSHTGLKYRPVKTCPATAELAAFFSPDYQGDGLRIEEIVEGGPLDVTDGKIKAGNIITQIDHQKILKEEDYFPLLAGKAGKWILLTISDGKKTFEIHVKPIAQAQTTSLLYKRWVKRNQKFTEEQTGGQIGYVHVQAMNSPSFREVYSELLGKFRNCKAVIVDERHNGGGWLHGDLGILLSGKQFQTYSSRGQLLGTDPYSRWNRPSCVLVCEDCYSNAHGFPSMYKDLGIGKLVGSPMAGTMTAVWWERMAGGTLTLGLPEVYCLDMNGKPLENQQLNPDIEVFNTPAQMLSGNDEQLKRAIQLMQNNL